MRYAGGYWMEKGLIQGSRLRERTRGMQGKI